MTASLLYRAQRRDLRIIAGAGMLMVAGVLFVVGLLRDRPAGTARDAMVASGQTFGDGLPFDVVHGIDPAPVAAPGQPSTEARRVAAAPAPAPVVEPASRAAVMLAAPELFSPVQQPVSAPAASSAAASPSALHAYTVKNGDCLWCIAADVLGPNASDAQVNAAWHALYNANAAQIGANPNVIEAGTVLQVPASLAA